MSAPDNIALSTVGVTFIGLVTVTWLNVTRRDYLRLIKVKVVSIYDRLVLDAIEMQIKQRRRREREGGRAAAFLVVVIAVTSGW